MGNAGGGVETAKSGNAGTDQVSQGCIPVWLGLYTLQAPMGVPLVDAELHRSLHPFA